MGDKEQDTPQECLDEVESAGWAPTDLWDNRGPLDWKTKYPEPRAQRGIRWEAAYCGLLFVLSPTLMLVLWLGRRQLPFVSPADTPALLKYAFAWLGGMFGGVLFDIKWLYHSVAKEMWHEDRRLWRLLMPHLSGGLAFAVVLTMSSGMFGVFDRQALLGPSMAGGIGFLVGYFSDRAVAKLSEVADTLFGTSEAHGKMSHRDTEK